MNIESKEKVWAYLVPLSFNVPMGRITKNTFTIGRKVTCDLVLCQPYISHIHITIYKRTQSRGYEYTFVSHSKNRLYHNNTPISDSKNRALRNNDQIWLVHKSMVRNCRQIGFIFKTECYNENQALFQKYETKNFELQEFALSVRQSLNCCRCAFVMLTPICLQPCCHKVCELCALWMVENVSDKCPIKQCDKKVLILLEDTTFSKVTSAYHKCKFGQEKVFKSTCFVEPFLMHKWVKQHAKTDHKQISETNQKNLEKQSRKNESIASSKMQKPQQDVKITKKNTSVFQAGLGLHIPQINFVDSPPNRKPQENITLSSQPITNQELEQFLNELSEINQTLTQDHLLNIQESRKFAQINSQHFDSTSIQATPIHKKAPAATAECWNCKKKFPFTLKKIEQKQCQICREPFCNKQFPPCKSGQQPLRSLTQRLRTLTKQNILGMISQKQKKVISNKILPSIKQQNELAYLFKYVLMKSSGCFIYVLRVNEKQVSKREIKLVSCVCEECWAPLGRKMLLTFLKNQESQLKTFSCKNVQQIIKQVSESK